MAEDKWPAYEPPPGMRIDWDLGREERRRSPAEFRREYEGAWPGEAPLREWRNEMVGIPIPDNTRYELYAVFLGFGGEEIVRRRLDPERRPDNDGWEAETTCVSGAAGIRFEIVRQEEGEDGR